MQFRPTTGGLPAELDTHPVRLCRCAAAREGGSHLWVYAPTRERATRLVGLLADCHYELLHYLGEGGVETVEGTVGSTLTDQGNGLGDGQGGPDGR